MNQLKALFFFVLSICSLHTAAQRIKGSDTVLPIAQQTAENHCLFSRNLFGNIRIL